MRFFAVLIWGDAFAVAMLPPFCGFIQLPMPVSTETGIGIDGKF
jgi:hypothetical protein